ncbi:MAG: class I SAM-dependent methyltransferase [Deltaproteobacteria bacterium]|nr:MAG: class I SAM-dependent methyltransferase [Deltaproteobacteria bacterium]
MRLREHWPIARSRLRRRDFAAVFDPIPRGALGDMLEVGSGDGFLAALLSPLGRSLTTTEYAPGEASHGRELPRLRCSVTTLPFCDAAFDFIFSSSVLEHVRDRDGAMAELRRCLRPDGVMVHLMPSPTWKLLQLALYYPHVVLSGIEMIGAERQLPAATTEQWRDGGARPSWWQEFKRGVFPQVHGEFDGHVRELLGFRARAWTRTFLGAGFDVRGRLRLPLCSGYGFGLERLRRAGERCGLGAHNAFIVTHRGAAPPILSHWPCALPAIPS